ncbi:MAG: serine--tRNA ligase, partial [Cyanobacteria bacterium P01_H01_bin.121]
MLDIKQIRQTPEVVKAALARRGPGYDIQPILDLDQKQRELEVQRSQLQARSNEIGKQVGQKIKSGAAPNGPEVQELRTEGNTLKQQIGDLEPQEREFKAQVEQLLLSLPNLPADSVP